MPRAVARKLDSPPLLRCDGQPRPQEVVLRFWREDGLWLCSGDAVPELFLGGESAEFLDQPEMDEVLALVLSERFQASCRASPADELRYLSGDRAERRWFVTWDDEQSSDRTPVRRLMRSSRPNWSGWAS